jgi:hypothetical protein
MTPDFNLLNGSNFSPKFFFPVFLFGSISPVEQEKKKVLFFLNDMTNEGNDLQYI